MKKSEEYRIRAKAVEAFRDDLETLIGLMKETRVSLATTEMRVIEGKEVEQKAQYRKVGESAGRATQAAKGFEKMLMVEIPGRARSQLQVIQSWQYALDAPWMISPDYLLAEVSAIAGQLHAKAEALDRRERSLIGRLALFVGLPARVRATVMEDYPSLGKAGFGAGVGVQIIVTTVATALAAAIVAGVVALWKVMF